jgi:hypothetical protein
MVRTCFMVARHCGQVGAFGWGVAMRLGYVPDRCAGANALASGY